MASQNEGRGHRGEADMTPTARNTCLLGAGEEVWGAQLASTRWITFWLSRQPKPVQLAHGSSSIMLHMHAPTALPQRRTAVAGAQSRAHTH